MNSKNTVIVYFSYSGNNKLLAEHLAAQLGATVVPIVEKKKRTPLTLFLDIFLKRIPKIEALEKDLSGFDHVIFLSPLWAGKIANPLKALLLKERDAIKEYSFVTFCGGYENSKQMEAVKNELQTLTGKEPKQLFELDVSDLFSREERKNVKTISGYKVKPTDLGHYKSVLDKIGASIAAAPNPISP